MSYIILEVSYSRNGKKAQLVILDGGKSYTRHVAVRPDREFDGVSKLVGRDGEDFGTVDTPRAKPPKVRKHKIWRRPQQMIFA